ncbi:hypothetical protein FQN54_007630 [Arachnomyces sp. PD_36]|nr:hypothetical protein FQN54_007630 [Arachnomyces sp. PD_36]
MDEKYIAVKRQQRHIFTPLEYKPSRNIVLSLVPRLDIISEDGWRQLVRSYSVVTAMEVAGVVFGAVPLILYALDSYKRAWEPVMDFWRWDDTIMTIRNNMFLQKQQLDTTLAILNLKDPTLDEVERALLHRFPEKCEDFMAIIREMDSLINQVAGNLYPDAQGQSSQADHPVLGYIPIPDSESYQKLCIETIDSTTAMNSNIIARKRTVDLNSLLSGTFDPVISRHLGLTRKQRFGIAAALAWAVLHLCDSPWLEKEKLCGDEIQMFLESQNRGPASHLSTYPYLSCRFRLPDSGTRTTTTTGAGGAAAAAEAATGSQNNEEEFQNKQVQNITLFTLAIRLIELGLNMSFSEVRERNYPISTCSTPRAPSVADDYDVAKYQVERLCRDPGRTYADAADRCLRFLFPGPEHMNNFGYDGFRKSFYEDVVAPIQATYELIPGSCSGLLL